MVNWVNKQTFDLFYYLRGMMQLDFTTELNYTSQLMNLTKEICIHENDSKIYIFRNQRVLNLFQTKKFTLSNFESEYYRYLEYGIVIVKNPNSTVIYNDIYGAYPLFLTKCNNGHLYLKNYFKFDKEAPLNERAIVQLMHFNHFLGENTLNENTKRLSGGLKITLSEKTIDIERIINWEFIVNKIKTAPEKDASYCLKTAITASLSPNTTNNKLPILTLTGGFDSRLLLSVLLKDKMKFETLTWGLKDNLQTKTAIDLSNRFGLKHHNLVLENEFFDNMSHYLDFIIENGNEFPFIIDIPQFVFMCENLEKNTQLITGFMGSEIIRGPSYSSQVTLTKFAAEVLLCSTKEEIKQLILNFQHKIPFLDNDFILRNLEVLMDEYATFAKIDIPKSLPNYNVFRYLFYEKYAKIYGHLQQMHFHFGVHTINPYMDFDFIVASLKSNKGLSELTPFENNFINNFFLYRFYAKEMKKIYPDMLHTKMDRGYNLKDLVSFAGLVKLVPVQIIRKVKKKKGKVVKVVDAYSWFKNFVEKELTQSDYKANNFLQEELVIQKIKHPDTLIGLEKIKLQLLLGLKRKMK